MIYEINHIWAAQMKWKWRNDRHSERNLCNCVKKPEKNSGLQRGLNPWPRDLPVWCSTNWAKKPMTSGAGQLWVHMFPWMKWVLMIYEINHIWTAQMKWKWRNDRRSECNLCNCVIFISFAQLMWSIVLLYNISSIISSLLILYIVDKETRKYFLNQVWLSPAAVNIFNQEWN